MLQGYTLAISEIRINMKSKLLVLISVSSFLFCEHFYTAEKLRKPMYPTLTAHN
jgi:hypothetical protein